MKPVLFPLLFLVAHMPAADAAMLYTCRDRAGNISITDSPLPDAACELRDRGGDSTAGRGQRAGIDTDPRTSVDDSAPQAEVIENLDYTYYTADADSRRALPAILTASSPLRHDGRVVWGYYNSTMSWKLWRFRKPDGRCRITKITIEINGNVTLPRLQGGTYAQQAQFDTFLSALRTHELGHHNVAKDSAAEIGRRILALPEMVSCTALESAANDLGQKTIDEYKGRSVRYDRETGHGRTQGARFD